MPYVSALENIFREIDTHVDDYLSMSNHRSSKFSINDISYIKSQNLDEILQGMFQAYASKLQESRERTLFDDSFDRVNLDKELSKAMNQRYNLGVWIFFCGSATVASFGAANLLNPNYPGTYPVMGSFVGAGLSLIEHWGGNPIGKLLMSNYTDSKILGTTYYEDRLKHKDFNKIRRYAKKYAPELLVERLVVVKKYIPLVSKEKILDTNIFSN
jgi:hypothetical protein